VKPDRTLLLVTSSILIFVFSFFLPLVSVHSYCENRIIAGVFGVVSIAAFLLLFHNRAVWTAKKTATIIGGVLCFLALAVNVAFILYATHLCRHMFDQLHPWNGSLM
jgi:nitrate reductase gamma subunit